MKKLTQNLRKNISLLLIISLILFLIPQKLAFAASLTALSDTLSRMKASTASNHTIKFTTPSGVAAGQTMTITFPTGFTIGSVDYTDIDVADDGVDLTLAATASGTTWGAAFSGQVLTITSGTGTIAGSSVITIEIGLNATFGVAGDAQIINQTVAQNNTDPKIVIGGTFGDAGTIAVEIVADDQVVLSASVDPSITFSLSANSSAFGSLSTGSVTTSSPNIDLTIATNANAGYTITVKDQGSGSAAGLYNSDASYNIASASATLSAGTEGYGIQGSSAQATIASPYNVSGNQVGALQTTAQNLATYNTSTSGNHTITVTHKAAISGSTKAGSYGDTLTYIATGNF
jgi:hypothetical protein